MKKRHVDYVKNYAANLTPVIPHDARLSPNSVIDPNSRGKVPGVRKRDGTWVGGWKHLGKIDMLTAQLWDSMGAEIGFRTGFAGLIAIDIDLTVKGDVERVLKLAHALFGPKLAIRRVDHPDHVKLLICLRLQGDMPRSFDIRVKQSDGEENEVQFLGPGRYFNVHGTHPRRLRSYVWDNDPADLPLVLIDRAAFDLFWRRLQSEFDSVPTYRDHVTREVGREPERCSPEELADLLAMIPNDAEFDNYDAFVAMGCAIYGASNGQPWGRAAWLEWCSQVEQGDDEKPARFWDTMLKARIGAEMLLRWANKRHPQVMAKRAFADAPIEPEALATVDAEARLAETFLASWCLVNGSVFYRLPPEEPINPGAFDLLHAKQEKRLRRVFGEKKKPLSYLFAEHSDNIVAGVTHMPGKPRFIVNGERILNLWSPPARPHRGKPIDLEIIDFYEELVAFVLGDPEEARLWTLWHAYLLQRPDQAPGWHWIIQTDSRFGKDLIKQPISLCHGRDYDNPLPRVLASDFNGYAEKHLIVVSEMKDRGREDVYTMLKALTSGNPTVQIHRKRRDPYLAPNVAGFVIYSNDPHPLRLAHDDQRFRVVRNFGVKRRSKEYYAQAVRLFERHWAMIGEWLIALPISDVDLIDLKSTAPESAAKTEMSRRAWEQMYLDIVGEIESDDPPPGYLPVAAANDLFKWFEALKLPPHDMPNRLEFPDELYRLGARPLNPTPGNPKRANPIGKAGRLWRIAKTWIDKGITWNIEIVSPARLAKLYNDRVMPPADLKGVDKDEDSI